MQVLKVLSGTSRNSAVDIFRGIAIIVVVLFHYNHLLPFGYLGVDLFFVISGLLVGGLITREFRKNGTVHYLGFVLQRGFKIWPSYYAFLFLGSLLVRQMYSHSHSDQIIPFHDIYRYAFFYQNYTGLPAHWSFDHVWSLCVEEHFYLMLPVYFLLIRYLVPAQYRNASLYGMVGVTILAGFGFKIFSLYFTNGQDTYSATHNRIDALAWGVLLNLLLTDYGDYLKSASFRKWLFPVGLAVLFLAIGWHVQAGSVFYQKVVFHSIIPFSFFLMIAGVYFRDFSSWYPVRFVAYFSYNWYLWHPMFVFFITDRLGVTVGGTLTFLVVSFIAAVLATVIIEERFLKWRPAVMKRLFPSLKN